MNIKLSQALLTGLIMSLIFSSAQAQQKQRDTTATLETQADPSNALIVQSNEVVTLDANQYVLPKRMARYKWTQLEGPAITIRDPYAATTYFVAPMLKTGQEAKVSIQLNAIDAFGRQYQFLKELWVLPPQPHVPPVLNTQRNDSEILIPAKYHPLGNELIAVLHLPEGASANNPVPGCAIIHGSGGLFKEVEIEEEEDLGQPCMEQVESVYQNLSDHLIAQGIATILPSSFYSRDNRFCEDNEEQYLQYAGAPFFNGNDTVARDDHYKIRRVTVRTMDMLATMNFFCDLAEVDCSQSCMVGTSNGATSIMSYSAQSLPKDLLEFMDDEKRPFEYNSAHQKRNDAFANFPALTISPITLKYNLTHRPLPNFAQLVSPGCSLRDLVPDIEPGNENHPFALSELYYPANDTELTFEVGSLDDVPDECYTAAPQGDGLREVQARYYEQQSGINANDSRYIVEIHQGGDHGLLSDDDYSETILDRLDDLIFNHLTP